jgi:hypothetical protein
MFWIKYSTKTTKVNHKALNINDFYNIFILSGVVGFLEIPIRKNPITIKFNFILF